MKNTIAVTPAHTLVHWSHAGKAVIYPLREHHSGETRGGIPLCVPMFSVQQRPVAGCDLPLHGQLLYSHHGEITHDEDTDTITGISHFSATDAFAWNYTATTTITETATALSYQITISRAADCPNPDQMPLSLGIHPYFATHGQDFSITIGEQTWTKNTLPDNIMDSAFAPNDAHQPITITTAAHKITMQTQGFDEYCLWTDAAETYICIEPIWQYREFGLPETGLQPGEDKAVAMSLIVEDVSSSP